MADPPPPQVLLIIRFTASLPDLPLPISTPKTTTTLSLKQLIRKHLAGAHATSRLRLIHAGKVLADTAPLTTSLSLPPPPPPRARPPPAAVAASDDAQGKGKQRATQQADDNGAPEPRKVYIHCSIGDALTPTALAAEATGAANAEAALEAAFSSGGARAPATLLSKGGANAGVAGSSSSGGGAAGQSGHGEPTTDAAPRGFDRLLNAGFTPAEVQQLRSQFRANLSFTHTPDTMPSAEEIRVMEDRWLDNDHGGGGRPGGTVTDGATGGGGGGGEGGDVGGGGWGSATWSDNGGLDDMLYGNVVGFFWPLGALGWGFREEGVWSRRRQIAVLTGFLLNIIFGFLKLSG
ncbi:hypothetical protein SLS54_001632 [Diplodia seriata]